MKLPAVLVKIRTGQVWQKRTDLLGRRAVQPKAGEVVPTQILITGKARSRNGNAAWHTARYDQSSRVSHAVADKDLWRFYDMVGNDKTVKPLQNEHLKPPQQRI